MRQWSVVIMAALIIALLGSMSVVAPTSAQDARPEIRVRLQFAPPPDSAAGEAAPEGWERGKGAVPSLSKQ